MWRFLRIVEKQLFKDPQQTQTPTGISTSEANTEFCKLRTIFGRKYTSMEGVKACFMAEKLGYIGTRSIRGTNYIGIKGEGLKFTALSGLLNELAGTIGNIPPVATLIVSLIAIAISIIALTHSTNIKTK
jgi:hypothetical protein